MIRGILWNIRGMRKKGMDPYMRKLMVENKFDFICIYETILKDFSEGCLRRFDPDRDYLWNWIPAQGKSRGGCSLELVH
jgi:hypothetical protein